MWGKDGANLKKVSLSDAIAVCSLRETSPRLWRIRLVGFFLLLVSTVPPVVCDAQPQGATWKQRKQKKKKKYADMKTTKDEIDYTNIFRFFAQFLSSNTMPCCRKPFSLFFSHVVYRQNCLSPIQICRLDAGFYHYHGSETTPPCKQNHQYLVMNSPVQVRKG